MPVEELTLELDGSPVFLRRAGGAEPLLYLHGSPTSSDDWQPLLERTGGIAPDLPGFGRSGKGGQLDYSTAGQAAFLRRLLDTLGVDQVRVVAHDSAAPTALLLGQRARRLELIAPELGSPAGRRLGAVLRRPLLGELAMGCITRGALARHLRGRAAVPEVWTAERIDAVWGFFDHGTQRAILHQHRAAAPQLDPVEVQALTIPGVGRWEWLAGAEAADRLARRLTG